MYPGKIAKIKLIYCTGFRPTNYVAGRCFGREAWRVATRSTLAVVSTDLPWRFQADKESRTQQKLRNRQPASAQPKAARQRCPAQPYCVARDDSLLLPNLLFFETILLPNLAGRSRHRNRKGRNQLNSDGSSTTRQQGQHVHVLMMSVCGWEKCIHCTVSVCPRAHARD